VTDAAASIEVPYDDFWLPQGGSQVVFLRCPVFETLYEGERGGGKTDCLIMSYTQHVNTGLGADWRGVIFRKTYKQLRDVVSKTRKWFRLIYPHASFNQQEMTWTWPTGEQLFLSYMRTEADYDNHHGHGYAFVGWEELTAWANDVMYKRMFSCIRSSNPRVPLGVRATTNPYGVGHNWVKARFKLPGMRGLVIRGETDPETGDVLPDRVAINSKLVENQLLLRANPNYRGQVLAAARNPSERRAWASGDWDIVAGGMFDDIWDPRRPRAGGCTGRTTTGRRTPSPSAGTSSPTATRSSGRTGATVASGGTSSASPSGTAGTGTGTPASGCRAST
jgi:hypothetical protein